MNLKEELLKEHSLVQTKKISYWAAESKTNLKQLMQYFIGKDKILVQRASWAASKVYELKPEWFDVYIPQLIACLEKPIHGSVRRNSLRIMQTMQIPDEYQSSLIDRLFILLSDPKEESAVKAFGMTVAYNVIKRYPELGNELKIIIEDQLPYATPSFKSRANKIIKKL
ncbi:hypothetical protein [Cytophaga aurantiaca]|uniref:hypothetical protein n=1 Tax=Cytophaga aurantiaca TaxID=29530 RepID=UPI00037D1BFA|nr:hypothetical protein [Cytophaga aurantiaca]